MPDHLHCIWTLLPEGVDFSTRWRLIKTGFTKHCPETLWCAPNTAQLKEGEQAIWQHRYWEHQIRDETDFARHVKAGVYASDWESDSMCLEGIGHE